MRASILVTLSSLVATTACATSSSQVRGTAGEVVSAASAAASATARATLYNTAGDSVGALRFTPATDGVRITGEIHSIPPAALHGIHFHAVGRCDGDFESAGGHFNPSEKHHGLKNPLGPHAGDLPNVAIGGLGILTGVDLTTPRVTLDAAPGTGVFDADGTSIVVHRDEDDQRTDPSGNSGARVACGVVRSP